MQADKRVSKLLDSNTLYHSWSLKAYHTTISIINITIITDITSSYVSVVFILKTDKTVYKYLARMGRHHMQPFGGGEVQVSDGGLGLSDQDREGLMPGARW